MQQVIKMLLDQGFSIEEAVKLSKDPKMEGMMAGQFAGDQGVEASRVSRKIAPQPEVGPAFGSLFSDEPQVTTQDNNVPLSGETLCGPGTMWNGKMCVVETKL